MTPKWAAATDKVQAEIVATLRASGFGVELTHRLGAGFPDALVWRYDVAWVIEMKGEDGQLTSRERAWWISYTGPGAILRPSGIERWIEFARMWIDVGTSGRAKIARAMRSLFVDAELQR